MQFTPENLDTISTGRVLAFMRQTTVAAGRSPFFYVNVGTQDVYSDWCVRCVNLLADDFRTVLTPSVPADPVLQVWSDSGFALIPDNFLSHYVLRG